MKKNYKKIIILIFVILILIVSVKNSIMREIYYLIFVSFIVSYILKPIHLILINKGVNKRFSAILLLLLFFATFILLIIFIVPLIFKENIDIDGTAGKFQLVIDKLNNKIKFLSNNKTFYVVLETAYKRFDKALSGFIANLIDGLMNISEDIISFAVVPIIVYYFLADADNIFNKIVILFPAKSRIAIKKISKEIDKILGKYIAGQLLLCLIIGILTLIILLVLHVDFPIILSLCNAVFNIIPYFGPILGAIPAIVVATFISPKLGLWTAILLVAIQQVEGNIISPKITGDSVDMHPLTVIILVIIGGKIGGFAGMVLAVPIAVIIKVVYEDLYYYLF